MLSRLGDGDGVDRALAMRRRRADMVSKEASRTSTKWTRSTRPQTRSLAGSAGEISLRYPRTLGGLGRRARRIDECAVSHAGET